MKSTDLRAKARAIFGSAIAEPMPKQPNGAKALQQRANARPIPTYKVGGVVKKADGGGMKPKLSTAERKMGDALMMTRKGKEVMSAQKQMEADKEKAMAAKRAKADKLLGITAKKDGGKVQKKAAGGVTDPYGGMPAPLQQPNTSGIGAYPGSTGQVGGAEQYTGAGPRQMQQQISNPNAPATAYKKGGKIVKKAVGGAMPATGRRPVGVKGANPYSTDPVRPRPGGPKPQGNVRKPMVQGQALQGQALRKYLMADNPGKPATRPQAGIPLRPKMPGRGSILNPDDIKQVRAAMGVSAPSARERAQSGYDNYMNQMRIGVSTGNYDPTPYGDPAWQKANKIRVGKPLASAPASTPTRGPSPTSNVMVGSGMVAQPAPAPGYKKGGKAKDGLAVMIAIGSPKKPVKKADGGSTPSLTSSGNYTGAPAQVSRSKATATSASQKTSGYMPKPAPEKVLRERVVSPNKRAAIEAAADRGARGAPRTAIGRPLPMPNVAKVQYKDGGTPVKKAVGGAGKVRKDMMPVKKAQGGAGKVRKGMMSPEGKILDAIGKARGK